MINLIDILTSGELSDWGLNMVIRGTPININNYIQVSDDYIIYKLSEQGIFPKYIDNDCAYFEEELKIVALINMIQEQIEEG